MEWMEDEPGPELPQKALLSVVISMVDHLLLLIIKLTSELRVLTMRACPCECAPRSACGFTSVVSSPCTQRRRTYAYKLNIIRLAAFH